MKKIVLCSIIAAVLAAAVALGIVLYFKNKHASEQQSSAEQSNYDYEGEGCDCGDYHEEEFQGEIVIDDENIGQAASFASEFFVFSQFPFIENYSWISISSEWPNELRSFIDGRNNSNGEVFMSLFLEIYKNRTEYLNNGKLQHYVKLIAALVPRKKYVANGWDTMVRQLLIAHDDLSAKPGSFSEIHQMMLDKGEYGYGYNATYFYDQILSFVSDKDLEAFIQKVSGSNYSVGEINTPAVVWAYSFWARRHNENPESVKQIAAILRMLRDELYPPIAINDKNIGHAASFASEFFKFSQFPFIDSYLWTSISYGYPMTITQRNPEALERFVNNCNNSNGEVFMALFLELYKNKAKYLSNGKLKQYVKLFAALVPRKKYVANGWDTMVRQLLIAHDDLSAKPGSFSEIYQLMTCAYPSECYDGILQFVSDKDLSAFIQKVNDSFYSAGKINKAAVVWTYSFWARRHNESPESVEQIAAILRMLRDELY